MSLTPQVSVPRQAVLEVLDAHEVVISQRYGGLVTWVMKKKLPDKTRPVKEAQAFDEDVNFNMLQRLARKFGVPVEHLTNPASCHERAAKRGPYGPASRAANE